MVPRPSSILSDYEMFKCDRIHVSNFQVACYKSMTAWRNWLIDAALDLIKKRYCQYSKHLFLLFLLFSFSISTIKLKKTTIKCNGKDNATILYFYHANLFYAFFPIENHEHNVKLLNMSTYCRKSINVSV